MVELIEFKPDWTSSPGETIADILEERNLSVAEFANRMGQTPRDVQDLLTGSSMITIDTARKLEVVLGASAAFWMIRETQYRDDVIRLKSRDQGPSSAEWLRGLPLKDMVRFGWLKPSSHSPDKLTACLSFFGVPDINVWRQVYGGVLETAAFRTSLSFDSETGAVAAWLRQGELQSQLIPCKPWDSKRFQEALFEFRSLTRKKNPKTFLPDLVRRSADCGVAVAIVRAPTGCRASGATRFLSSAKALLVLSFRYLSDDHFWFTFFHEAGHLVLHGKNVLFLEGRDMPSTKEEREANDFAAQVLIPSEFQAALLNLRADSFEVIRFARRIGVSPGIVVGQLQHLGRLRRNQLNILKRRFSWNSQ
jgi:addiction module HigA family antidote